MRVLITGGCGFIGSAVIRALLADSDHVVVNLDALTYAATPEALPDGVAAHPRYRFERADVRDGESLRRVFAEHRPDAVMHLAAESHVDRSIDGPAAFVDTNIVGTFRLLEAALEYWRGLPAPARAAFRFHHVSTDEVYGSLGAEGRFTEEAPYRPRSPYSASKAAADHLARAWHETYGLPVLLSNCSNNYGPWQFPEKLIPLMIIKGLGGEALPVYGDGGNVRDWLYVDDHAEALRLILERGAVGAAYNVGGHCEKTNLEVVEALCDLLDALAPAAAPRRSRIAFVPDRPGHDRRYAIDAGKIARDLGWRPRHDFAAGLRRTVAWYLANRPWWQAIRARYGGQRLGLGTGEPCAS